MVVSIREYNSSEEPQLIQLAKSCTQFGEKIMVQGALHILAKSSNARAHTLTAKDEETIVGFIMGMGVDNVILFPHSLYVSTGYRNRGIGSSLLRTLETSSKCEMSLIYYNAIHDEYYKKNGYKQGSGPEDSMYSAMKQLK